MLAAFDWGECFVSLNVMLKPAFDEAVNRQLAIAARRNQDGLLALLAEAQLRDSAKSQRWTAALVQFAVQQPSNGAVLNEWAKTWAPLAEQAVRTYCDALPDNPQAADHAVAELRQYWSRLGLS